MTSRESSVQPYWMRCKTCGSHVMSDARIYRVCDGDPETGYHDCQLERIDRPVLTPAPSEKPREGATPRTDALRRYIASDMTGHDAPPFEQMAQHAEQLELELASMTEARDYCLRTMTEAIEENTTLRSATTAIPADIAEAVQSAITSAQIGELAGWEIDLIERRICSHAYKLRTADKVAKREGP